LGTNLRLLPYNEIEQIIAKEKAPLLMARPLVESQNILELIDYFPGSKAIWVYRHFQDVVNSSVKKFGTQPTNYNLRAVIDDSLRGHWYSEKVSDHTRKIVTKYFTEDRSLYDLKALGWCVRNILYFELKLYEHPDITLCKYEDIVTNPDKVMRGLYSFLGYKYPGRYIVWHIHNQSVGKGKSVELSEDIKELCTKLLKSINEVYALSDLQKIRM